MSATQTANRPAAGWTEPDSRGHVSVVVHDCDVLTRPPEREGFVAYFIGRHGIGPGSWTRWTYKPMTS